MRISDWSSDVCSSDLDPDVSIDVEELAGGAVSGVRRVDVVFTELERGYPIVGELRVFGDGPILELAPKLEWSVTEYEYEIGRASCRERVCQYVSISVVAVSLKNTITKEANNTTDDIPYHDTN